MNKIIFFSLPFVFVPLNGKNLTHIEHLMRGIFCVWCGKCAIFVTLFPNFNMSQKWLEQHYHHFLKLGWGIFKAKRTLHRGMREERYTEE